MRKLEDFSHLKPAMLNMLEDIERLRTQLLDTFQRETVFDYINDEEREYRKPIMVHGYPVFHFACDGPLLLNEITDKKTNKNMKSYIEWCMYNLYHTEENGLPLQNARIFIQHFFKNNIISDLDNRNHKFIIDALRMGRIIKDDNWQNVAFDISGHPDDTNHVQIYIIDEKNRNDFSKYLDENKYNLKAKPLPHEMFLESKKEDNIIKNDTLNDEKNNFEGEHFWG